MQHPDRLLDMALSGFRSFGLIDPLHVLAPVAGRQPSGQSGRLGIQRRSKIVGCGPIICAHPTSLRLSCG